MLGLRGCRSWRRGLRSWRAVRLWQPEAVWAGQEKDRFLVAALLGMIMRRGVGKHDSAETQQCCALTAE